MQITLIFMTKPLATQWRLLIAASIGLLFSELCSEDTITNDKIKTLVEQFAICYLSEENCKKKKEKVERDVCGCCMRNFKMRRRQTKRVVTFENQREHVQSNKLVSK